MMSYFGGFGAMSVLAWMGMLIFWGALIALAVWVIRRFAARDSSSDQDIAQDVLRRRYAADEIRDAGNQQALKTLS